MKGLSSKMSNPPRTPIWRAEASGVIRLKQIRHLPVRGYWGYCGDFAQLQSLMNDVLYIIY
jgi:hypothetical protein